MENAVEKYVFPFFWQHGEDEKTLRHYMQIIDEANCHAVCVESRPHPDFCGPKWWKDMDIILDEAKKRGMKVWILDDSHFPTGFANGAAEKAPDELRRQSVYTHIFEHKAGQKNFSCKIEKIMKRLPSTTMGKIWNVLVKNNKTHFSDDCLLELSAKLTTRTIPVKLDYELDKGQLRAVLPDEAEKIYVTFLTRNAGIHRSYINMLDEESCRLQIDAVYEPHWEHYKEEFGKTIAGFFSDEPEIGNGVYFNNNIQVGQDYDMAWSRELEKSLKNAFGDDWRLMMPFLWDNDLESNTTAKVRYVYMDCVTRLVEKNFSRQIGDWCKAHGVEYIGHMIEDNNQHARLGASLGHYFRGLSGQHMAGIDDIGGQVIPQGEDREAEGINKLLGGRDGEFYHYLLGKLGVSAAAIDPEKKGRCMCEIFGNYGWSEGPRLEKFLADHFMVQGVNRFVPHAFSPKEYPDRDCPPHFYANGNNPQYRHFGQVIEYMNRICPFISNGRSVTDIAILYHAEGEWTGKNMLSQKPARILMENQVDFHILPCDVFAEAERYKTQITQEGLLVNGNIYKLLIVPYMQYIPRIFADALRELQKSGCRVIFLGGYPECSVPNGNLPDFSGFLSCTLDQLMEQVEREGLHEIVLKPAMWRIRAYHYKSMKEIYYLVNEDDKPYDGIVSIPSVADCYEYDAWADCCYELSVNNDNDRTEISIHLSPGQSSIIVLGKPETNGPLGKRIQMENLEMLERPIEWKRSVCRSIEYPNFHDEKEIREFSDYGKENSAFSGFIAYETKINTDTQERVFMEITDAGEDVEVFVNGISLGIQVLPPFLYELTDKIRDGENIIRIEVATTLERERKSNKKAWQPIGITGRVNFYKG